MDWGDIAGALFEGRSVMPESLFSMTIKQTNSLLGYVANREMERRNEMVLEEMKREMGAGAGIKKVW